MILGLALRAMQTLDMRVLSILPGITAFIFRCRDSRELKSLPQRLRDAETTEASLTGHRATERTENNGILRGNSTRHPSVLLLLKNKEKVFLGVLGGSVSSERCVSILCVSESLRQAFQFSVIAATEYESRGSWQSREQSHIQHQHAERLQCRDR